MILKRLTVKGIGENFDLKFCGGINEVSVKNADIIVSAYRLVSDEETEGRGTALKNADIVADFIRGSDKIRVSIKCDADGVKRAVRLNGEEIPIGGEEYGRLFPCCDQYLKASCFSGKENYSGYFEKLKSEEWLCVNKWVKSFGVKAFKYLLNAFRLSVKPLAMPNCGVVLDLNKEGKFVAQKQDKSAVMGDAEKKIFKAYCFFTVCAFWSYALTSRDIHRTDLPLLIYGFSEDDLPALSDFLTTASKTRQLIILKKESLC